MKVVCRKGIYASAPFLFSLASRNGQTKAKPLGHGTWHMTRYGRSSFQCTSPVSGQKDIALHNHYYILLIVFSPPTAFLFASIFFAQLCVLHANLLPGEELPLT